ncbi:uncharacterized protein G2W53_033889 [Senna tora]|uniref:Uncharacterized protein n=1 Tax=Senna tora TaxID=362788 RepID=A0A834W8X6_9FABA|nr:uncharacterized protein G2W53_033889 [Senna tora]
MASVKCLVLYGTFERFLSDSSLHPPSLRSIQMMQRNSSAQLSAKKKVEAKNVREWKLEKPGILSNI